MNASNENAGSIGINTPRNQHKRSRSKQTFDLATMVYCCPVVAWLRKSGIDICRMTGLSAETARSRNLKF